MHVTGKDKYEFRDKATNYSINNVATFDQSQKDIDFSTFEIKIKYLKAQTPSNAVGPIDEPYPGGLV